MQWHILLLLVARAEAIHNSHDFFKSKFGLYAAENYSQAVGRELLAPPDMALYTPHLDSLFNDLDNIVEQTVLSKRKDRNFDEKARLHAAGVSTMLRAGSTARYRHQTDFYYRLGTSPWIKTVCEIGTSTQAMHAPAPVSRRKTTRHLSGCTGDSSVETFRATLCCRQVSTLGIRLQYGYPRTLKRRCIASISLRLRTSPSLWNSSRHASQADCTLSREILPLSCRRLKHLSVTWCTSMASTHTTTW